jgi:hypothetical protein
MDRAGLWAGDMAVQGAGCLALGVLGADERNCQAIAEVGALTLVLELMGVYRQHARVQQGACAGPGMCESQRVGCHSLNDREPSVPVF